MRDSCRPWRGSAARVLTRLVEDVITGLRGELGPKLESRRAQEDVYRTVFWLLAAKILHDKSVPNFIRIDLKDVDEVFERIRRHHGETRRFPPFGRSGRPAIDAAAERIADCGSLADVSSESLAHVYENALIDKTAGTGNRKKASKVYDIRKELGIHSTPSVLINHMLSQLWPLIEDIKPEDRHVFEPACGHAPFLTAAMRWLRDWGGVEPSGGSHQYLRSHLHGLEADSFAMELARLALTLADEPHGNRWDLAQGDMFEQGVLARHADKARILLANPPYERFTEQQRRYYKRQGAPIAAQTKAVEMLKRSLPSLPPGSVFGIVAPVGVLHDKESRPVRELLLEEWELTEIDVFADNLFEHSDHEVAVLMGRRRTSQALRPRKLLYRRVREHDMAAFKDRLAFSWEESVAWDRFLGSPELDLRIPELDVLWTFLHDYHTLGDIADVGQGFSFHGRDLPANTTTLSRTCRPGFRPCFAKATGDPPIFGTPQRWWMNTDPAVILSARRGLNAVAGQVLVNHARTARGPWTMKAWVDHEGLAVKGNFLVVRSIAPDVPPLVLWALLNSPVANAYVYCRATKRHIIHGDLLRLPIPPIGDKAKHTLVTAARYYVDLAQKHDADFMQSDLQDTIRQALLALDAEVLRLYDLPPRLEHQLLDLFTGVERKGVGCEFRGYYPPGLDAYVPLHELISEDYARSTLGRFREAPHTVSPDVLEALQTATEPARGSEERQRRYAKLSTLLDEWAAEAGGFDSRVGPLIEQALEDSAPRHSPED